MEPSILVASSCTDVIPTDRVIKEILETQDLPEPLNNVDGVRSFRWHINTKYYEADVHVCSLDKKTIGNQEFAESVNAIILCFDSNSNTGLETVEQWLTFTKEFEPDISILLCETCVDSETFPSKVGEGSSSCGVKKIDAQKWCVENNFELVELNPIQDETDAEDDFPESLGMKRVIQALQAHIWPNLKLKEKSGSSRPAPGFQSALNELNGLISGSEMNGDILHSCATSSQGSDVDPKLKIAKVKPILRNSCGDAESMAMQTSNESADDSLPSYEAATLIENQNALESLRLASAPPRSEAEQNRRSGKIDAMLEAMDALPEENFEQLFQNLSEMKSKAENLSPTQRRAYAEKMTLAFWRSIGGNESEIEGLSSDEEGDAS